MRKIPYDVCKITGNEDQAKKDTGNLKAILAEATGCKVLIQEDNPVNLTPSIPEENEQKTPDQDGTCDLLALSEEISGQESHDHEPHKMSKAKENLSEYEELDDCRRPVEDPHVYQKLVKA